MSLSAPGATSGLPIVVCSSWRILKGKVVNLLMIWCYFKSDLLPQLAYYYLFFGVPQKLLNTSRQGFIVAFIEKGWNALNHFITHPHSTHWELNMIKFLQNKIYLLTKLENKMKTKKMLFWRILSYFSYILLIIITSICIICILLFS